MAQTRPFGRDGRNVGQLLVELDGDEAVHVANQNLRLNFAWSPFFRITAIPASSSRTVFVAVSPSSCKYCAISLMMSCFKMGVSRLMVLMLCWNLPTFSVVDCACDKQGFLFFNIMDNLTFN